MTPVDFLESTRYLGPATGDETIVDTLPVLVDEDAGLISCWRLTPDELQRLNENGGHVMLTVCVLEKPPPVALWVADKETVHPLDDNGEPAL